MKPSGVSPKEACQLDTETGFVLVAPAVFLTARAAPDDYEVRYEGHTAGGIYSLC